MPKNPIRVLVIDDSAVVREAMTGLLDEDPGIEVMGAAADPFIAANKMEEEVPDVITLDIEMPRMDGLTFLKKIMTQHPLPVIICSTLTEQGSDLSLRALETGALDIITKPKLGTKQFLEESRVRIVDAVKAAAEADLTRKRSRSRQGVEPKKGSDAVTPASRPGKKVMQTTEKVVLVGASTGGTEALSELLASLPLDAPGLVVVQHMPEHFTAAFAQRLDTTFPLEVKEAEEGDSVLQGRVLIAPGNRHLMLQRSGARYRVHIKDGPFVSRHRPSVDVLFRTGARYAGSNAVGVLLTGMGDDGAQGLKEMHDAGAFCIAQDEASCVVYGMPAEAVRLGAVDAQLPLRDIGEHVVSRVRRAAS
jgi:two-component system chemotaxis response regulator CheB